MRIVESPGRVEVEAHAKVNLFLDVVGKRSDGYHDLETVMQEITLADELVLEAAGSGLAFDLEGESDVPAGEGNLVVRAVRAVERETDRRLGVRVRLRKRIPAGAGLGGGSADAAAMLVGLDRLFGLDFSRETLGRLALDLGSDVPFFLTGGTACCTGRGEIVEPIPSRRFRYMVVTPPVHCSTAEIFRLFNLTHPIRRGTFLEKTLREGDYASLGQQLSNRLEPVCLERYPELRPIRERLDSLPAGVTLSGSGSSFVVVPADPKGVGDLPEWREALQSEGRLRVFVVEGGGVPETDSRRGESWRSRPSTSN